MRDTRPTKHRGINHWLMLDLIERQIRLRTNRLHEQGSAPFISRRQRIQSRSAMSTHLQPAKPVPIVRRDRSRVDLLQPKKTGRA